MIVSIAYIYEKGRKAALRGEKRDSHGMNWFVPALPHWLEGHDAGTVERIEAEREEATA